jgi:quinol monooxygenase YgiN
MIAKIAHFLILPEHLVESIELIQQFSRAVHYSEPGTRIYISLQDKKNRHQFKNIMVFDSQGAEEIHSNSTKTMEFAERLYPLCKKKPIFEDFEFIGVI